MLAGAETTYKTRGNIQCDRGRDAFRIRVRAGSEESIQGDALQPVEQPDCNGLAGGEGHDGKHHRPVQWRAAQDAEIEGQERHLDQPLAQDVNEFNDEE